MSTIDAEIVVRGPSKTALDIPAIGAAIAATLCFAIMVGGWVIEPAWGWLVGLIGLPGTTWLAWRTAPNVVGVPSMTAGMTAVGLAVRTIMLADLEVVGLLLLGSVASGGPAYLVEHADSDLMLHLFAGAAAMALYGALMFGLGLVFVGIPASFVVVPAAALWAALVRVAAR